MIQAIIVDDEPGNIEVLKKMITAFCKGIGISATAASVDEAITVIKETKPDLVFLDIEMPHMNGFDMLEQFDKLNFDVVFCTAYDQFAIKAFKYSALNYLLKPVDPEDLKETIRRIEERQSSPSKEQIDLLFQTIKQNTKPTVQRIALTTGDGMVFVPTQDILYCSFRGFELSAIRHGFG